MKRLSFFSDEIKKYRSQSRNTEKRKEIQLKFNELYKTNYNKLDPGSIKYLEFKTLHKTTSKDATLFIKSPAPKDIVLDNLQKHHINLKECQQIYDLPKSP